MADNIRECKTCSCHGTDSRGRGRMWPGTHCCLVTYFLPARSSSPTYQHFPKCHQQVRTKISNSNSFLLFRLVLKSLGGTYQCLQQLQYYHRHQEVSCLLCQLAFCAYTAIWRWLGRDQAYWPAALYVPLVLCDAATEWSHCWYQCRWHAQCPSLRWRVYKKKDRCVLLFYMIRHWAQFKSKVISEKNLNTSRKRWGKSTIIVTSGTERERCARRMPECRGFPADWGWEYFRWWCSLRSQSKHRRDSCLTTKHLRIQFCSKLCAIFKLSC